MPEPLSAFFSTHLNSRIDSIEKLACRNMRLLGGDLVNIELAQDTAYECIANAVELYTIYTEPKEEFLLFDSELYTQGMGIKLDNLMSYTPELSSPYDPADPNTVVGRDYDLQDWRKVIDVKNIEVGENSGNNLLFTLQYALVQQMAAMHMTGGMFNKGFDLVSYYAFNEFLELRNKMLAMHIYTRFDPHTQILQLFPDPKGTTNYSSVGKKFGKYFGLIAVYVEPRFRDCLKNYWVQSHSLAQMKIAVANVRGKYGSVQLFGGGSLDFQTMMSQGIAEKERLEQQLLEGTGGFVGSAPASFLVF